MNYPLLLQATALGVLALAGGQAVLWGLQLRDYRSSIRQKKHQSQQEFIHKLKRVRAKASPRPPAPRAWNGEQVFCVANKTILNDDTCLIELAPGSVAQVKPFLPGQHLFLSHKTANNERILRCYSIVNSPLISDRYRVVVRRIDAPATTANVPSGAMSSYVFDTLNTGDMIMVKAPAGHFYLRRDLDDNTPLLLVGFDIGILAILSMADTVRREQAEREVHVIYVARDESDVIQCAELEAFQQHSTNSKCELSIVFSETSEGLDQQVVSHLTEKAGALSKLDLDTYIAGYSSAVNDARAALLSSGMSEYSIRTEIYKVRRNGERRGTDRRGISAEVAAELSAMDAANDSGVSQAEITTQAAANQARKKSLPQIVFSESERAINWLPAANSLLEFAEEQRIDIPSDCRMGSCHTCMTRLISGEVDYVQPPYNEPDAGYCLPCIAVPTSDVELEL